MKLPLVASAALAVLVALAAGCQSTRASRIQQNAALFATLDPATQQIVRDGLFARGFSRELTYLSLGNPNHVTKTDTEHGTVETWKYQNFLYANIGAMEMSANTPGSKAYGPIVSSSAPGGPSLFSTKAGPLQPTLPDASSAPVGTLYLEFLNGNLVSARVDL
jgi:hypothetical protein